MHIHETSAESSIAAAVSLMGSNDEDFVQLSRFYANKLTAAQTQRNYPGGVLAVFEGTSGHPARPLIGVIKAEMQEGFRRARNLQVQYFKDLFLTPQTKLYKIGIFRCYDPTAGALPAGWTATVYDSQMTATNREGAAQYFYESFLGCILPVNSAHLTRQFFEKTRDFIGELEIGDEEKADLFTALYTYLKVDQTPTIQVDQFAEQHMEPAIGDNYAAFMRDADFPDRLIQKDLSEVGAYLKKRRMRFRENLVLSGPPEAFESMISIKTIEGENDETWTQITVKSPIRSQE